MKQFTKATVALSATGLLAVLAAQPAAAAFDYDHENHIRVSNRSLSDRTACIILDNPSGDSGGACRNLDPRTKVTWRYQYNSKHAPITITVRGGGREYKYSFEADKPTRDLCFRYSASGSFHPAKDCKI